MLSKAKKPSYPGNEVDFKCLLRHFEMNDSEEPKLIRSAMRFDCFYKKVTEQPLSSFTRAMELKCRSLNPVFDDFFNIDHVKYSAKIGMCAFFHNADDEKDCEDFSKCAIERFRISIPDSADETEARDIMAHELAHLYNAVAALESRFKLLSKNLDYRAERQKMLRSFLINYIKNKAKSLDDEANATASFILNKRVLFCKYKAREVKMLNRAYEDIVKSLKKLKTNRV